ncbi:hypothetical protein ACGFZG_24995 [Streptomyces antibioticus]|uniref:hypothetical protein n=1 Tax=Streptomyces antibioticus TaxID=1890 RepID=UPI00371BC499
MTSHVQITEQQLPEQLRLLLATFEEAQRAARAAADDFRRASIRDKHGLQGPLDEANRAAAEAHVELLEGTRAHPLEMRQYSHAQFASAVERARDHMQAAEAELRAAAGHAAVYASVRPGRPCVNTERVERAEQAPGKQRAMFTVSMLREVIGALPEGVD